METSITSCVPRGVAGGGQLFEKKQVQRETAEEFWSGVETIGMTGLVAVDVYNVAMIIYVLAISV